MKIYNSMKEFLQNIPEKNEIFIFSHTYKNFRFAVEIAEQRVIAHFDRFEDAVEYAEFIGRKK